MYKSENLKAFIYITISTFTSVRPYGVGVGVVRPVPSRPTFLEIAAAPASAGLRRAAWRARRVGKSITSPESVPSSCVR